MFGCNFFDVSLLRNWAAINRCVTRKDSACDWLYRPGKTFWNALWFGYVERWNDAMIECFYSLALTKCNDVMSVQYVWLELRFLFYFICSKNFFLSHSKEKKKRCVYPSILFHLKVCVADMCPRQSNVSFSQINFYICAKIFTRVLNLFLTHTWKQHHSEIKKVQCVRKVKTRTLWFCSPISSRSEIN